MNVNIEQTRRGDRGLGKTIAGGNQGSFASHQRAAAAPPTSSQTEDGALDPARIRSLRVEIDEGGGLSAETNALAREVRDHLDASGAAPSRTVAIEALTLSNTLEEINAHPESIAIQAAVARAYIRGGQESELSWTDLWCIAADPGSTDEDRAYVEDRRPEASHKARDARIIRREPFAWEDLPDGVNAAVTSW